MFIGYLYLVVVIFSKIDMKIWNCFGHEKELLWNLQCNVLNISTIFVAYMDLKKSNKIVGFHSLID
jgi:hypothetical protein